MADRLRLSDITSLRMSVAATKTLAPGQIERLLDEVERLLREHDEMVEVFTELQSGPWRDVRRAMGELQRTLDQSAGRGPDPFGQLARRGYPGATNEARD